MTDGTAPANGTGTAPDAAAVAAAAAANGADKGATPNGGEGGAPDWRTQLAGGNADRLKLFERFTDIGKVGEAFDQAQRTIRDSGRVKIPGADAKPEEIAAYNKARGVPETHDKYQITAKAPEGLEIGEPTKALLGSVTERLHKLGADTATVNFAHELIYEQLAGEVAAREAAAGEAAKATELALKQKWGGEYETNVKYADSALVQFAGAEGAKAIIELELADGSRLGAFAPFIEAMAQMGLQFREDPHFLEAPAAQGVSVKEEIEKIMKLRLTDEGAREYDKPETQNRLQRLLAQRDRMAA